MSSKSSIKSLQDNVESQIYRDDTLPKNSKIQAEHVRHSDEIVWLFSFQVDTIQLMMTNKPMTLVLCLNEFT